MISNQIVEFEVSATVYIIGESLFAYERGYVVGRCSRRQNQTLISQILLIILNIEEFENLSVEKKTLWTALGFVSRSFRTWSTALTTEQHRLPTSLSTQEDLFISPSGSALRL